MKKKLSYLAAPLFCLSICLFIAPKYSLRAQELIVPKVQREFRAAWVASVANINWPSEPGLPVEIQKKEAIHSLDLLYKLNFNAVIFQVRPQGDALFQSNLEPWSFYLTGKQGQAPDPFYDPLDFWLKEAHKRSLELHVWLNPYRAHHPAGGEITDSSVVKKFPDMVLQLKNGYWWFDPGNKITQQHCYDVVMDLVKRYDIDGVHFDDYFYPYPDYNNFEDFPDSVSWSNYLDSGGSLTKKDWRRENVNTLVKNIYEGIKNLKPFVKFGLSPFGIWRPNNPESIKGFDQFDILFADAKLWLNEGWIDYFSPQLYWKINDVEQSYPVLLGWWKSQNVKNRHIWPGINIYHGSDETRNQIMITRGMLPESCGNIHWSIFPLESDSLLAFDLLKVPYKNKALIPSSSWAINEKPPTPQATAYTENDSIKILCNFSDKESNIFQWIIYSNYEGKWNYKISRKCDKAISIPLFIDNPDTARYNIYSNPETDLKKMKKLSHLLVSAVNRFGEESNIIPLKIKNQKTEKE